MSIRTADGFPALAETMGCLRDDYEDDLTKFLAREVHQLRFAEFHESKSSLNSYYFMVDVITVFILSEGEL